MGWLFGAGCGAPAGRLAMNGLLECYGSTAQYIFLLPKAIVQMNTRRGIAVSYSSLKKVV